MSIRIKMFPASFGDSFFVEFEPQYPEKNYNIMIDSGFKVTYKSYIKPFLKKMNEESKKLDLLVITHIDMDHISGMLQLIEENGDAQNANIIKVDEVWHNSYRHLVDKNESLNEPLCLSDQVIIQSIEENGYETNVDYYENSNEDIGAEEGSSLAGLLMKGKYNWNSKFDGNAIKCNEPLEVNLSNEIKLILLSPDDSKLAALQEYWQDELIEKGFIGETNGVKYFDDAFEFLVAKERMILEYNEEINDESLSLEEALEKVYMEDSSVTNGSSISFVIEHKDKKMLFLADSHPGLITENLKKYYQKENIFFDLIKISHHGSKFNTSTELLNLIDSQNYLISTNSNKFKHPDIETVARIVCRKTDQKRTLVFNYKNKLVNFLQEEDLQREYNFNLKILNEEEFLML